MATFEENYKPICHWSPRPLLELASMKIALNIWLQRFSEYYQPGNNSPLKMSDLEFNTEIPRAITLPRIIRKIIDAGMYPMSRELHKWVRCMKPVLKNLSYDQIYTRLNLVVFGGNGTVHIKDTITNFLEDESLNNLTRFEIACVNCVEEKIDQFWPLLSSTLNLDNLQFDNCVMMYYWICRKEGQLDRIPLGQFNSIEQLMIHECRHYYRYSYLAVEYFFTLLNPDNRLVVLDEFLLPDDDLNEVIYLENELFRFGELESFVRLFPNIDDTMQRQILERHGARVLYVFVTCLRPVEYAIQCFHYVRNFITPPSYCNGIIMKIIDYAVTFLTHHTDRELSEKAEAFVYARIEIAMEQIWLNTPPHLKEYAVENLSTILEAYSEYDCHSLRNFRRNIRFLLLALSDASVELRNNVWNKHWPYWIYGVPPSGFEDLMRLCLIEAEAIEEFKNTFPYTEEFRNYCNSLIWKGYFTELDAFLSTLYADPELVLDIKKHVLSNEIDIFHLGREAIEKYVRYIENLFSNQAPADDFKHNLILSEPILNVLLDLGILPYYGDDIFCSVEIIISLFISPQNHGEIKNKFLELFHYRIISGPFSTFDESRLNRFLSWCMDNDEQRMDDFMESFEIDDVFETTFFDCLKEEMVLGRQNFACLEKFLLWYFQSNAMAESYVRETIDYYERMDEEDVERIFDRSKDVVIDLIERELLQKYTEHPLGQQMEH